MFVNLHNHSEYSPLDGMSKIEELVVRAKELGQPGIAITDHGSTSGLYDLQKYARKHNIKPILGSEFYFDHGGHRGHLVLLAKNNNGLKNIFKLQELSYVKGFNSKPQITLEMLHTHSSDLVCLSACIANQIAQHIIHGKFKDALELAKHFQCIFGEDFYLELQSNTIPEQEVVNKAYVKISEATKIPLVVTNDTHYTFKEDAEIHEVVLAMQQNKSMSDPKRWKFSERDFWFKSEEEIKESVYGVDKHTLDIAIRNTVIIHDKTNAEIYKGNFVPHYHTIETGKTEDQMLREMVTERYKARVIDKGKHTAKYVADVKKELEVIERNGYSGYHLIVQDYVNWARRKGIIVGDGRGSGAGCKVAYILGITEVDPEEYGLIFERFLADGRKPDYDIDFSDSDLVFDYLTEKYGIENVARIIAFGTLAPRAGVRKVFSTFDHPQSLIAQINGCMPKRPTFKLAEAYAESEELCRFRKKYPKEFHIIERLEGMITHESQHAGGVIICKNLGEMLPVKTKAENKEKRIVALDKYMLEDLGHYKFDLLWLETLKVVQETVDMIREHEGIDLDLHAIDLNDANVYDMLCKGDLSGVFQLAEQAHKVMQQQPRNFKDLIAINALIRPGVGDWEEYIARRNGKPYDLHELRKPYLDETYGIITYQEQFMLDCHYFAGWDLAWIDKKVRKNKNIKEDKELHDLFISSCTAHDYNISCINQLWNDICDAVDGGLNEGSL